MSRKQQYVAHARAAGERVEAKRIKGIFVFELLWG